MSVDPGKAPREGTPQGRCSCPVAPDPEAGGEIHRCGWDRECPLHGDAVSVELRKIVERIEGRLPDCPTGLACTGCRYCETEREEHERRVSDPPEEGKEEA